MRAAAARDDRGNQQSEQQPDGGSACDAAECRARDVAGPIALRVLELRAAVFEARVIAHLAAVGQLDRLLGIELGRERRGVGLLAPRAQRLEHEIEHAQHLDRIRGFGIGVVAREARTEMHRIEQAGDDEHEQHGEPDHAAHGLRDAPPRRTQVLLAANVDRGRGDHRHQQVNQPVGPQHDDLERHQDSLTRGSTSVYEMSVSSSPAI